MKRLKKVMFIHSVKKINLRPDIYIYMEKTSISGAMTRREWRTLVRKLWFYVFSVRKYRSSQTTTPRSLSIVH